MGLKFKRVSILLLTFLIIFSSFVTPVYGDEPMKTNEKRIVRIGYYNIPGFQEYDEKTGVYSGYSYEYLIALAQYANWEFEFVPVEFADGVKMLENGELDLMNNVSKTDQRLNYLSYSNSSSGSNCAYLATENDNTSYAYEDFDSFNNMTVGLVKTSIYSEKFLGYCRENGFMPNIKYYDTKEEASAALGAGEIDARVITSSQNIDMHIIAKFAPEEFYFAVPKDKTSLLGELNKAMRSLKTNDPDFESRLQKKYYNNVAEDNTILTEEEKQFIKDNPVIDVVYDKDFYPLSYEDEDGNVSGTMSKIYNLISRNTGLKFNFIGCEPAGLKDYMKNGKMMVFEELPYNYVWSSDLDVNLTPPFTEVSLMDVRRNGFKDSTGVMAVVKDYYLGKLCRETYGDRYTYKEYKNTEACMEAVRKGDADVTCITSYESDAYQARLKYRSLSFSVTEGIDYSLSIGVSKSSDPCLFSIMMKALNSISADEMDTLFKETSLEAQQPNAITMLLNYPLIAAPVLIVIAFLVAGIIFFCIHYNLMKKKNQVIKEKNKQLAEAVVQADKASTAKSQFLSRMSHEIRTPMNAIVGLTEIAKNYKEDSEKIGDYLRKIGVSSKVLLNIINDVLDMSAIEGNKLKIQNSKFDLKQVLNGISTIYYPQCEAKGITFEMAIDVKNEILKGDSLRVNQILLNLVSNAYKFTEAGGTIRIYVKEISQKNKAAFIRFTVSDTGCGMTEDMKNRLFKPFEQESANTAQRHGGSGLGLSIAKNLVELMHGAVKVESEKGKGTTFTVDLPFEIVKDKTEVDREALRVLHILVVDDDEEAREYTSIVLKRIGMKFDSAESGERAMDMISGAEKEGHPYDVCLIDWKMPGMDGVELINKIRGMEKKKTKIIIVSAYDLNEVEDDARKAGADYFVTKPLFQSTIFNVLMTLSHGELKKDTAKPKEYDFTGHRVLLAEDNELNAEIATTILELVHMEADRAEDGQKVVDMFREKPEGYYDAILMDVQMPAMDGYEAAKTIRSIEIPWAKTIPIYAMTANAFTEDVAEALSSGMNGHIAKPIDTEILYSTLSEAINKENK